MKILTGKAGIPHVTSEQFRQFVEGTIGIDSCILKNGEYMEPELISNNQLKIKSGMMHHHGCLSLVKLNTYDTVSLDNGAQEKKRIDLVVNRYTRDNITEIEDCNWVVIKGVESTGAPAVPVYTVGNLQDGDLIDDCPVFEVHYDGLSVTEVKKLLGVRSSMAEMEEMLDSHNHNYLPLTGGDINGTVTIKQNTNITGLYVQRTDTDRNVLFGIGGNGYYIGVYDNNNKRWLMYADADGNVYVNGNASTASKLATARTISLTGSVTGSGTFDGSGNLIISTTANHSHNHFTMKGTESINSISNDTTAKWGAQQNGIFSYNTQGLLNAQPSQHGLLLNLTNGLTEVHQLWLSQPSGSLHHRGGNSAGWSDTWKTILDTENTADYVVSKSNNMSPMDGWVWQKWNSGIAEAWMVFNYAPSSTTQTFEDKTITFPFAFIDIPVVNANSYNAGDADTFVKCINVVPNSCLVYVRNYNTSSTDAKIFVSVKGRWK